MLILLLSLLRNDCIGCITLPDIQIQTFSITFTSFSSLQIPNELQSVCTPAVVSFITIASLAPAPSSLPTLSLGRHCPEPNFLCFPPKSQTWLCHSSIEKGLVAPVAYRIKFKFLSLKLNPPRHLPSCFSIIYLHTGTIQVNFARFGCRLTLYVVTIWILHMQMISLSWFSFFPMPALGNFKPTYIFTFQCIFQACHDTQGTFIFPQLKRILSFGFLPNYSLSKSSLFTFY